MKFSCLVGSILLWQIGSGVAYADTIDHGCAELNAAYEKSRNSSRYQVVVSLQRRDNPNEEKIQEQRFDGIDFYTSVLGGSWKKEYRDVMSTKDFDDQPIFDSCRPSTRGADWQ